VTRRNRALPAAAAAVVVAIAVSVAVARSGTDPSTPAEPEERTTTAPVERGALSAAVSLDGTLTYAARSDGSPWPAVNRARGTYTDLPDVGAKVHCGDELYRVDDQPVLLLCGVVPTYRGLHVGDRGNDVQQLNTNLHRLGFDAASGGDVDADDDMFTNATAQALRALQEAEGAPRTGALSGGDALFLPGPLRIAEVSGQVGGPAEFGAAVLAATSTTIEVHVSLQGSQQRSISVGDRAEITMPDNTAAVGVVDRLGAIAPASTGASGDEAVGPATLPASISLDDPRQARGLDQAPVHVEIATRGVDDVLSVPATAIVGQAGGGFAVEVVRDSARRELVAVELGLFDTTEGRVEIEGEVREGDDVVVPSS
jgi:peptidoglycan hydrolase-like protein with peptidoglycan-binding domain